MRIYEEISSTGKVDKISYMIFYKCIIEICEVENLGEFERSQSQ